MANQTTNLDELSSGQSQKEVTANDLFDALSQGATGGRRASTTSGLTWGFYGGNVVLPGGTLYQLANGTVTLTDEATNYLQLDTVGSPIGVVVSTSGWQAGLARLYEVTVSGGAVTNYLDWRTSGSAGGVLAADVSVSDGSPNRWAGVTVEDVLAEIGQVLQHMPYDVGGGATGVPAASLVLLRYPLPREVRFPASLTGSQGTAGTAATAQTDFDIRKNGVSVGTMRFAAAASTATFIAANSMTFEPGDVLTVVAPGSPDTTLADIGFALRGERDALLNL